MPIIELSIIGGIKPAVIKGNAYLCSQHERRKIANVPEQIDKDVPSYG